MTCKGHSFQGANEQLSVGAHISHPISWEAEADRRMAKMPPLILSGLARNAVPQFSRRELSHAPCLSPVTAELLRLSECLCPLRDYMLKSVMANLGRQLEQTKSKEKEVAETAQWVKCLLCSDTTQQTLSGVGGPPATPRQWELEMAASHQNRVVK